MPIEIRELLIRVAVTEKQAVKHPGLEKEKLQELKKKIVKECVEKVLSSIDTGSQR